MDHDEAALAFYEHIDADEYDELASLLDPAFVHERPDQTLEGRDRFVTFMREERPQTETAHVVEAVYENTRGDRVAVEGRLVSATGDRLFRFCDSFRFEGDAIGRLVTYTDR